MSAVYKDFLTSEEISSMLHNKDIWMTSDEVAQRLEKLQAARAQEAAETKE
jgi:arginine repressor